MTKKVITFLIGLFIAALITIQPLTTLAEENNNEPAPDVEEGEVLSVLGAPLTSEIVLEKNLQFKTLEEKDIVMNPGTYAVVGTQVGAILLLPLGSDSDREAEIILAAEETSHDEDLVVPYALGEVFEDNSFHLAVLFPGGNGLVSIGYPEGIQSRATLTRRKYSISGLNRARLSVSRLPSTGASRLPAEAFIDRTNRCSPITINIPNQRVYPLGHHVFGDKDIGSGDTELTAAAWLRKTPMRIWLDTYVDIRQRRWGTTVFTQPDFTEFAHQVHSVIFDARTTRPGCEIERLGVTSSDYFNSIVASHGSAYLDTQQDGGWKTINGKGIIKQAHCRMDTSGSDVGELGCDWVSFNQVTVYLKPVRQSCGYSNIQLPNYFMVEPLYAVSGGGDAEIGGNPRRMTISNERNGRSGPSLNVYSDRVILTGNIQIEEAAGDRSSFSRNFALLGAHFLDIPDHCRISSVSPSYMGRIEINAVQNEELEIYQGREWIPRLRCRTDSPGKDGAKSDQGGLGCRLRLSSFRLNLRSK